MTKDTGSPPELRTRPRGRAVIAAVAALLCLLAFAPGAMADTPPSVAVTGPSSATAGDTDTFGLSVQPGTKTIVDDPGDPTAMPPIPPVTHDEDTQIVDASWSVNGTAVSGGTTMTYTYPSAGAFVVSVTVTDDNNQTATDSKIVAVAPAPPPPPVAGCSANRTTGGSPLTVTFSDKSTGVITSRTWNFGDGTASSSAANPTHVFRGIDRQFTVTLTVGNISGSATCTIQITVGNPAAAITFAPSSPQAGELVAFDSSQSTPPAGRTIVKWAWTFTGSDGTNIKSAAANPFVSFPSADTKYTIKLTVTDSAGGKASASTTVTTQPSPPTVTGPMTAQPPTSSAPGVNPQLPASSALRFNGIVRIAGNALVNGARIKLLTVLAPKGATVRVSCAGKRKGCPTKSYKAYAKKAGLIRFKRMERSLRSGAMIRIYVTKKLYIGKYTRFTIRARKSPTRIDRCLPVGSMIPKSCSKV